LPTGSSFYAWSSQLNCVSCCPILLESTGLFVVALYSFQGALLSLSGPASRPVPRDSFLSIPALPRFVNTFFDFFQKTFVGDFRRPLFTLFFIVSVGILWYDGCI
ncbi:MAG: hypothetical protein PUG31_09115, partial [Eubacteriales bacterium]|nr:hypothetical protein [Eubacteriales bacterium]